MKALHLVKHVKEWPVTSQQAARRNALVAATSLTQLRVERAEVDAFVQAAAQRQEVRRQRSALA